MKYINYKRIEKINLNKSNFYVAIDFDKTITDASSNDSWEASINELGEDFNKKFFELYQKYGALEFDYTKSFEERNIAMEKWYRESIKLYYEYDLTAEKLKKSISNSNLTFRSGAKDFLNNMYKNNIPVVILSAGIGNVIEFFLRKNNCYFENIYIISNFIPFDDNGNIRKSKGKLIHSLNKTMEGHTTLELDEKIKDKKYRLLLGNIVEDKQMVPVKEWNRTISIRFFRYKSRRKF